MASQTPRHEQNATLKSGKKAPYVEHQQHERAWSGSPPRCRHLGYLDTRGESSTEHVFISNRTKFSNTSGFLFLLGLAQQYNSAAATALDKQLLFARYHTLVINLSLSHTLWLRQSVLDLRVCMGNHNPHKNHTSRYFLQTPWSNNRHVVSRIVYLHGTMISRETNSIPK